MKRILIVLVFFLQSLYTVVGQFGGLGGILQGGGAGGLSSNQVVSIIQNNMVGTTNIVSTNEFVMDTWFTNTSGSNLFVVYGIRTTASLNTNSIASLYVDFDRDGTWESKLTTTTRSNSIPTTNVFYVSGEVPPNSRYTVTNLSGTSTVMAPAGGCVQRIYSIASGAQAVVASAGFASTATSATIATTSSIANIAIFGRWPSSTNGNYSFYDTNHFYLGETFTLPGPASFSSSFPGFLGLFTYNTNNGFWNQGAVDIYITNFGNGQQVYTMNGGDFDEDFLYMTNNGAPSIFPVGPWFPNIDVVQDTYGVPASDYTNYNIAATLLQPTTTAMAQQSREVLRNSSSTLNSGLESGPMIWIASTVGTSADLTNMVTFVVTNNLLPYIDAVEEDSWTTNRDANGLQVFEGDYFGLTMETFTGYVHSNGLKAGLHFDPGTSQPVYERDATNAVLRGLDFALLDTTVPESLSEKSQADLTVEFAREFHKAAAKYQKPFFVAGAVGNLQFQTWFLELDTWWKGADSGTETNFLNTLQQSSMYNGRGKYPFLNIGPNSTFTNTLASCELAMTFCAIGPANLQIYPYTQLNGNLAAALRNDEMRRIMRDPIGSAGWPVSSNATGVVWARMLANGDTAVAFINISASAGTLSVNLSDLKIATNAPTMCRDIWRGTNIVSSTSISKALVAHEGSLWRLSRTEGNYLVYQQATNAVSMWPTSPATPGGFAMVNSNGTVYIITSLAGSSTWAATNKIAP